MKLILGGNEVRIIGKNQTETLQFADDSYHYSQIVLSKEAVFDIKDLKSARVFLLSGSLMVNDCKLNIPEDSIQFENTKITITALNEKAVFLVVGCLSSKEKSPSAVYNQKQNLKKVSKPWGYEIWITGEHPLYCLKKIFIRAGTKTSLQYHNFKRETNVLVEGAVNLHYKKDQAVHNSDVTTNDITAYKLEAVSVIDVLPQTVHRLEALSDILLYEASTPQLDDVIRLIDDSNRSNGRVNSEHGN